MALYIAWTSKSGSINSNQRSVIFHTRNDAAARAVKTGYADSNFYVDSAKKVRKDRGSGRTVKNCWHYRDRQFGCSMSISSVPSSTGPQLTHLNPHDLTKNSIEENSVEVNDSNASASCFDGSLSSPHAGMSVVRMPLDGNTMTTMNDATSAGANESCHQHESKHIENSTADEDDVDDLLSYQVFDKSQ